MENRGITISAFLKSKEIKAKEIEENFKLVKRYDVNMINNKACVHCGNESNLYGYKSESWTGVKECVACQTIHLIYWSDRMGGNHTDVVDVYEQKNKPMYRLYFKCDIQKDCIECLCCGTVSQDKNDIENLFCKTCNKTLE